MVTAVKIKPKNTQTNIQEKYIVYRSIQSNREYLKHANKYTGEIYSLEINTVEQRISKTKNYGWRSEERRCVCVCWGGGGGGGGGGVVKEEKREGESKAKQTKEKEEEKTKNKQKN